MKGSLRVPSAANAGTKKKKAPKNLKGPMKGPKMPTAPIGKFTPGMY